MVERHTVNRIVFGAATVSVFAGWLLVPTGEATGNLSTVLISTGFFAGVWALVDIPRAELTAIAKVVLAGTLGFAALFVVISVGDRLVDGLLAPAITTQLTLVGQALGTLLLIVLPVFAGRELLRRYKEGDGVSTPTPNDSPEERVLSDAEYEDFDRL